MKLALSTAGKEINEELFASYANAGIKLMEVSPDWDKYDLVDYDSIKHWADKYGVTLWSYHLPFMPFEDIDISVPSLAHKSVKYLKELIIKANAIGIKTFVIHPSGEPIEDCARKMRMECAKRSLAELCDLADGMGCVIAVENLPRTCLGKNSEEIMDLVSADSSLRVCFDTNHLLGEGISEFVKKTGEKMITMHVSDYDFINERHWLPGEGKIDWQTLISELKTIGYNGAWVYELAFTPYWSIERQRDLTCFDFARNFDELMTGKPVTMIGKAKENIGMFPPKN